MEVVAVRKLLCLVVVVHFTAQFSFGRPNPLALPSRSLLSSCQPLIFIFGASMVDTGEHSVAMPYLSRADFLPYGVDYFSAPAGRWSNGRVITDFISQELGYGMLNSFLKSVNTNFTYGANFACAGSTARDLDYAYLFPLSVQVYQFEEFLSEMLELGSQSQGYSEQQIEEAVFLIETANNDYLYQFTESTDFDVLEFVDDVVASIRNASERLYDMGGRNFVVMSLTPLGCTPMGTTGSLVASDLDEYGCGAYYNSISELHNLRLQDLLTNLTAELPDAKWIYFDAYSIFLDAYHNPATYGIEYPLDVCCGAGGLHNFLLDIPCGMSGYVNGTLVEAKRCEDPTKYVLWDTIHPVESFAKRLADGILTGKHLRPDFNITSTCSKSTWQLLRT